MAQQAAAAPSNFLTIQLPNGTTRREAVAPLETADYSIELPKAPEAAVAPPPQTAPQDTSWIDQIIDSASRGSSAFGQQFVEGLKGLLPDAPDLSAQGLMSAMAGSPQDAATAAGGKVLGLAQGVGSGLSDVASKSKQAFEAGDWATGLRHAMEYALPTILGAVAGSPGGPPGMLLGAFTGAAATPTLSQAGDMAATGTAEGVGGGMGLAAGTTLPAIATAPGAQVLPKVASQAVSNAGRSAWDAARARLTSGVAPQQAEAVQYALQENLPVSLAGATGNRFALAAQEAADITPSGSFVATGRHARGVDAMRAHGTELATRVSPTPTTPITAAEHLEGALGRRVASYNRTANANYDELRRLEALPQHGRQLVTRYETSSMSTSPGVQPVRVPVVETVQLPVDLRIPKTHARSLLRELNTDPAWKVIAESNNPPGKAIGYKALQAIADGPDFAPLTETDRLLGAVKDIARRRGGVARIAVRELEGAVQRAASQAGPEVTTALRQGRAATVRKHIVQDVMDDLLTARSGEPRAAFNKATAKHDANIKFLRRLQSVAPDELPEIGRALFEEILSIGQAEGGFTKTATMWNHWDDIGANTKALLYPDARLRSDITKFLQAAKLNEQVFNTSRTAMAGFGVGQMALVLKDPTGFAMFWTIAAPVLAKYMHHPGFIRAVTDGIKSSSPSGQIVNKVAVAQILNKAGADILVFRPAAEGPSDETAPEVQAPTQPVPQAQAQPAAARPY